MVTVLAPGAKIESSIPGRVKLKTITLRKNTQYSRSKSKYAWLEVMIMCPSGATCLLTGRCLCLLTVEI